LWDLVWQGLVTNDTFHALRAFTRVRAARRRHPRAPSAFRSRRLAPPSAEGRWTLVHATAHTAAQTGTGKSRATAWITAATQQLLTRHGVITREALSIESIPGGFSTVYPVLKMMEESGRLRRGYFVTGLGAAQFALPGAVDRLRSLRDAPEDAEVVALAATDPANPYGATLRWPGKPPRTPRTGTTKGVIAAASVGSVLNETRATAGQGQGRQEAKNSVTSVVDETPASAGRGPTRTVGATVMLVNGSLAAYLSRGDRQLLVWLPEAEPERSKTARAVARTLIERARATGAEGPRGMLIEEIDGTTPTAHPLAPYLKEAGFVAGALGFHMGRPRGET